MTITPTFEKSIRFDRSAKDFRAELDGQLIGFFASYHAAEEALDDAAYDMLTHGDCATATELDGGQCSGFGCVDGCSDCVADDLPGIENEPEEPPVYPAPGGRAVSLQSLAIEARITTCAYCRGIHHSAECDQVKFIPLGDDEYAIVSIEDYDHLILHNWYVHSNGYVRATINHERVYMHRLVLLPPDGHVTDHINGNKLDNRRANLRVATRRQNTQNQRPKGHHSPFIGVTKIKQNTWERWVAQIRIDGKRVHLGYFTNEIEAARAYDRAAVEHHGEFARPNFPDEYHCKYCNGQHFIQKCPQLRHAVFVASWVGVDLGRGLCQLRWRNHAKFTQLLESATPARLVEYAESYVAFIRENRPESSLTAREVLSKWLPIGPRPAASTMQVAA